MPVARFCCACLSWRCSLAKGDRAAFLVPTSHKKGLTQSQLRGTGLSPGYYCTACPRRATSPAVRESCLPGTSLPVQGCSLCVGAWGEDYAQCRDLPLQVDEWYTHCCTGILLGGNDTKHFLSIQELWLLNPIMVQNHASSLRLPSKKEKVVCSPSLDYCTMTTISVSAVHKLPSTFFLSLLPEEQSPGPQLHAGHHGFPPPAAFHLWTFSRFQLCVVIFVRELLLLVV